MTSPPDTPTPDDGDPTASGTEGAPGVELGLSPEGGGTFEPEEDPEADAGR